MADETVLPSQNVTPAPVDSIPAAVPLLVLHPHLCLCLTEPGKRVKFSCCPKTGKCPCGLEVSDPRNSHNLFRCEIVHFDPPTEFMGRHLGYAACDQTKKTGHGGQFTGDINAVTCIGCMASAVFVAEKEKNGIPNVPTDADTPWNPPKKR